MNDVEDQGHKDFNRLDLIDTSRGLTIEELTEIKQLVALSKTSKMVVGIIFGTITLFGIPEIFSWLSKHFH